MIKNSDDYNGKYMKIKFNSDSKLPLNKMIEVPSMIIDVRAVFHGNNKYYPEVLLDECLYKLSIKQKRYIVVELTILLKKLILIKQVHQKSVIFITAGIFETKLFKFQQYVCNKCHDLLIILMNLSDITVLNIKASDYCCIVSGISKTETVKLLKNIDITEKSGKLYSK